MSNDGDMQRISPCLFRQNCPRHDFVGDVCNGWFERQERNPVKELQSFFSQNGISVRCLVDYKLGRNKLVFRSLVVPPLMSQELPSRHHDLRTWLLAQVADD